jgi:hypothetical protein
MNIQHFFGALLLASAVAGSLEAEISIIVPGEYADVEAPGGIREYGGGGPGVLNGYRLQGIFDASVFEALPASQRQLTGFFARPDGVLGRANSVSWPNFVLTMSTTTISPGEMGNEFAANHGADATIVYEGPITFTTENTGPAGGPKDFDIAFDFQIPFHYNPAEGNLVMDWFVEGPAGWVGDDRIDSGLGTTAWILNENRNSPIASQSFFGNTPVWKFAFVPEPSSHILLALGLSGLLCVNRVGLLK